MNAKKWSFLAIFLMVIGFAGMAYQKFEFGDELPAYSQKWIFDPGEFKSLTVDSDYDVDLQFIDSPDGTNYVEVNGNMKQPSIDELKETDLSGHALHLEFTEKLKWAFLVINFQTVKQHITVALSDHSVLEQITFNAKASSGKFTGLRGKNIDLSVFSGNIQADSITAERLKLTSTSGNITGSQIRANTRIELTSGNVKLNDLKGPLTARTLSGNITASGVNGTVKASVTSGMIRFDKLTGNGTFDNKSGNIILTDQRSDSLDIIVLSGNVAISADPEFEGSYDLRTMSGKISAPDAPQITTDVIKIHSASGNISIK